MPCPGRAAAWLARLGNGVPASGAPAGSDLALLRVHNPDAAAALASAVNDWLSAEWLAHELRLHAALVVPGQQPEMTARDLARRDGHPDAP
jgi:predicted TIM-barrel fold metal-dependent hydrolase